MGTAVRPLVGRHEELELLWHWLETGTGSLLVEGETGIGKTSIVWALAEMATRDGWSVRKGHCYEAPPAVPFLPFIQVLSSRTGAEATADTSSIKGLLNVPDLEQAARPNQEPGELRAQFLAEVTGRLLDRFDRDKTLLVVEDGQWADAASLLLANHLLDVAASVRVLFTVGSGGFRASEPLLQHLKRKLVRVDVGPLTRDDVAQLARDICGAGMMSPRELSWLYELTGGNPLFATEVLRDLRNSGLLTKHSAAEAASILGVPPDLSQLFDRRVAGLKDSTRRILELASAAQGAVETPVVASAAAISLDRAEQALDQAVAGGLLRRGLDEDGDSYAFRHPFVRRRIYERLTSSAKRGAHQGLAEACQELGNQVQEAAYLAVHLALAGRDRLLATDAAVAAAMAAEEVYGFESAARFWRLAAANSKAGPTRAGLLHRLGLTHRAAGDWRAAKRALERAYSLAMEHGLRELAAELAFTLGEICRFRLDLGPSIEWLEKSLALDVQGHSRRTRALALLASAYAGAGDHDRARARLEEAQAAADEHDSEVPFVAFWASVAYASLGDGRSAEAAVVDGLARARKAGDRHWAGLLSSLVLQRDLGTLKATNIEQALRDLAAIPQPRDAASVAREMMARTQALSYAGRWEEVLRGAENWMSEVRLAGSFQLATARLCWGEASYWLGDVEGAIQAMAASVPDLGVVKPLGAFHLARALAGAGRKTEVQSLVVEYAEAALATPRSVAARAMLGELACELQDEPLAERVAQALQNDRGPMAIGYVPISLRRVRGRLQGLLQHWDDAFASIEQAIGELTVGKAHWELVLACLDYADLRRHRGRRGDSQKALASEAEAVRILRDLKLPIGILKSRIDVARVPPGARFGLTNREHQILQLVAQGRTNMEIADSLGISGHTIDRHLENIFAKMEVSGRTQAVFEAFKEGLIVWP